MSTALGIIEMCYGDTGLLLSMPRQGLGNSAIAAVANDEQLERFKGTWAAMAITEPGCGSDSAAIRTTATKDGNDYILNGEKIRHRICYGRAWLPDAGGELRLRSPA
ncbi:acyl-CoA dehydrogenase family protein [Klebsiella pneumoniae]